MFFVLYFTPDKPNWCAVGINRDEIDALVRATGLTYSSSMAISSQTAHDFDFEFLTEAVQAIKGGYARAYLLGDARKTL